MGQQRRIIEGLVGTILIAWATVALAGVVNPPKVWSPGETLTASQLNATVQAFTAQINGNLDDSNVKATANIKGSKLASAPNGVPTSAINDGAVTSLKVLDGDLTTVDLSASANITGPQLSPTAGIVSGQILDGTLVGADVATNTIPSDRLKASVSTTCSGGWTTSTGTVASVSGLAINDPVRVINTDGTSGTSVITNIVSTTLTLSPALAFTPASGAIVIVDYGIPASKLTIGGSVSARSAVRDETEVAIPTSDPTGTLNCAPLTIRGTAAEVTASVNGYMESTAATTGVRVTASIYQVEGNRQVATAFTKMEASGGTSRTFPFAINMTWIDNAAPGTRTYRLYLAYTLITGTVTTISRTGAYLKCVEPA